MATQAWYLSQYTQTKPGVWKSKQSGKTFKATNIADAARQEYTSLSGPDRAALKSGTYKSGSGNGTGSTDPTVTDPNQAKKQPFGIQGAPDATTQDLSTATGATNYGNDLQRSDVAFGNNSMNADVSGPLGSQTTKVDPNTGKMTTTQDLSKGNQATLDTGQDLRVQGTNAASDALSKAASAPSASQVGDLQTVARDQMENAAHNTPLGNMGSGLQSDLFGKSGQVLQGVGNIKDYSTDANREQIRNSIYNDLTKNLETQYGQQKAQLQQDLANRGIPVGSDAFNKATNNFENQYQTYRQQAADSAESQTTGQQSALQGMANSTEAQRMADVSGTSALGLQGLSAQQQQQQTSANVGSTAGQMGNQDLAAGDTSMTSRSQLGQGTYLPSFSAPVGTQLGTGVGNMNPGTTATGYTSAAAQQTGANASQTGANASMLSAQQGQQGLNILQQQLDQAKTQNTTAAQTTPTS